MIKISLCMIVKNEEKNLARALTCLTPIMDELIIVDTGSTDNTKEIASQFTTKIYDYTWKQDFADARNYALSKATMDYIYVADADEVIDELNQQRFLQLKQVLLPEIDIVQMYYTNQLEYGTTYNFDKEYRPKLFKRVRTFQYIDPIHEVLSINPVIYDSEIEIIHKPHESHAKRDFETFQHHIKKGTILSKRLTTMYAKELYISGDTEDFLAAYPYFEEKVQDTTITKEELEDALCILARGSRLTNNMFAFFKYTMKAAVSHPCSELCYELGEYYYSHQDYTEAAMWYYNAAYETSSVLDVRCANEYPLQRLAACYQQVGDQEQARYYEEQATLRLQEGNRRV